MNESTIRHLEMIQAVIGRMTQNSFAVKGGTVTLVAAVIILVIDKGKILYLFVALLPVMVFWGLDAFYLRQERLFRRLYDAVRSGAQSQDAVAPFSMETSPYASGVPNWLATCWSKSIGWLYGVMALVILLAVFIAR